MPSTDAKQVESPASCRAALVAVLPVFVLTRLVIFLAATFATDSQLYYQYSIAARETSVGHLFQMHDVEYPQLAVLFSAGVGWFADCLPAGAERLISLRPGAPTDIGLGRFQVALGLTLGVIDLGLLLLLARLGAKLQPNDSRTQTWRLGLYVAGTAVLGPILDDRLDLVIGAVALVAIVALGTRRPAIAYALITAGVAFKVVPVVLLPVFVLAAAFWRGGRFWPAMAREAVVALAVVVAWPVLAVLFGGGDRAFIYTKYHGERGVELCSLYAAPLLMLPDAGVGHAFGGHAVLGSTADAVARAMPVVTLVALAMAFSVASRAIRQATAENRISVLAGSCVLVWLAFILTNKVGSPQYLLWLAPIVPLLALQTRAERVWAMTFVAAGFLGTLTYPYLWENIHGASLPTKPETWAGPTVLGFVLLFARWSLIAALTGWLTIRLWRVSPAPQFASAASDEKSALIPQLATSRV